MMRVHLMDGWIIGVPLIWFPTLQAASPEQRVQYRIRAGGRGLNWPDPDSLAGAVDPTRDQHEFEELGYLAPEVYEALTGEEMAPIERLGSTKPKGSRWEFDDGEQLARRLPRLARLYPD
jgi:hypothetical protein